MECELYPKGVPVEGMEGHDGWYCKTHDVLFWARLEVLPRQCPEHKGVAWSVTYVVEAAT